MASLQTAELVATTIQQAVDRGAASAERIHQWIAAVPFEVLARSGLYADRRWQVRARQQRLIGVVYETVRRVNAEACRFVSDQIENIEDGRTLAARLRRGTTRDARHA
jgi:hypothetical protein